MAPAGILNMAQPVASKAGIMRTKSPLLTIAIPTYNRAAFLRELLTSLESQLAAEPDVDLLIFDNASTDGTAQVVEEFEARGLRVQYQRNQTNIGADANFLTCFEQATGTYVWIVGDDDILVPGGLHAIVERLRSRSYDLVHINSFPLDGRPQPSTPSHLDEAEFTDPADMIKRVHVNFSFISGNIVNKARLVERGQTDFRSLTQTNLVQLGWIYEALNGFERGLYIRTRLVGARVDNTGGYKLTEVFGSRLKAISTTQLRSDKLARVLLNGTLQRFWPGMLMTYRRTSSAFDSDPAPARNLRATFGSLPRYWIFVHPILVLPRALGSAWFFAVRAFNWFDRKLGYLL